MSTPTRKDWILWGALGCALVATYHAEYTLAVAAGFHPYVALAVPGALDLYVIRALQQRRDVLVAVLAMVAANVASHLIAKDVLQVGWQVIAAVGAIAPLVLWRVYSLKHTRNRQELIHGVQAGALEYTGEVSAPEEYPASCPNHGDPECTEDECVRHPGEETIYSSAPCPTPYTYDARTGQPTSWTPAPDRIPDWMDQEYPVSVTHPCALSEPFLREPDVPCGECGHPWGDHPGVQRKLAARVQASTPPLPALPPEYPALSEDAWDELTDSDREYLGELNEYIHSADSHTLAGLRSALGIGQARATRLIKHARKEGVW